MNKQSRLLNLNIAKTHPAFRAVFLARFISIVSLGFARRRGAGADQMILHSTQQVGFQ